MGHPSQYYSQLSTLELVPISEWKWKQVAMDFVTGLPRTPAGHGIIWVIIDRLTKSVHFIPIKKKDLPDKLRILYIREIVRLHDVSVSIVSDRDGRFTSQF